MCGVVGIKLRESVEKPQAAALALTMLMRLQHRGQDGAGISFLDKQNQFKTLKGLGLIDQAFRGFDPAEFESQTRLAVAHTRYATTGTGGVAELQPFVDGTPRVAMAHNGNIVNTAELVEKLNLVTHGLSDLEVLQQTFLNSLKKGGGPDEWLSTLMNEFNGSFSVVAALQSGEILGWRDSFGLRPLFFAEFAEGWAFASETHSIAALGVENKIESVEPGGYVFVDSSGTVKRGKLVSTKNPKSQKKFCMFEAVYFSNPQSEFMTDSNKLQSVYRSRFSLGSELAKFISGQIKSGEYDYVVPVPETSRTAAVAVAEGLKIPYREFLIKNPYVSRTFILNSQEARLRALKNKLSLVGPEIKDKRILLVDDSVVRGNTSRLMAERLREAGATSVGLASTCPPIKHGCFYGIDFPDPKELVAARFENHSDICKSLGVNALFYLPQEALTRALGTENLCMACLDGNYPTRDSSFERFLELRKSHRITAAGRSSSGGLT